MVERASTQGSLSVEDYLEMEKTATVRHEYVAGEVYAMTGASRRHNRIAGNVYRRLADAVAGGGAVPGLHGDRQASDRGGPLLPGRDGRLRR